MSKTKIKNTGNNNFPTVARVIAGLTLFTATACTDNDVVNNESAMQELMVGSATIEQSTDKQVFTVQNLMSFMNDRSSKFSSSTNKKNKNVFLSGDNKKAYFDEVNAMLDEFEENFLFAAQKYFYVTERTKNNIIQLQSNSDALPTLIKDVKAAVVEVVDSDLPFDGFEIKDTDEDIDNSKAKKATKFQATEEGFNIDPIYKLTVKADKDGVSASGGIGIKITGPIQKIFSC